jgi:hypothetical protein
MKQFIVAFVLLAVVASSSFAQKSPTLQAGTDYFDITSDVVRQHTRELQEAQQGIVATDNGEQIVFAQSDGVWVQFYDGTGRRKIVGRGAGYSSFMYPAWSLDGKYIAFTAIQTDPRVADLIVANADGSNAHSILSLNAGYYNSFISSISWHWANQYIMFSYWYNDTYSNIVMVVCTINMNGTDFVVGPGPDRNACSYEPVNSSNRYAFASGGVPGYFNSEIWVSNLNGTGASRWLLHPGVINGFTHVAWVNSSAVYAVIKDWSKYPGKEVLLRVTPTSFTELIYSDLNAHLYCPTPSADRTKFYMSEMTASGSTMWLSTLSGGTVVTNVQKGAGWYPNWRQAIPATDVPGDAPGAVPVSFALEPNYPNPFNAITVIRYQLPALSGVEGAVFSDVRLVVYDLLGRQVSVLVNERKGPGRYEVRFDGSGLSSGVYFYRLTAGQYVECREMVMMK